MVKYLTRNNYPGDANALFDLVAGPSDPSSLSPLDANPPPPREPPEPPQDVDNEGLITAPEFGQPLACSSTTACHPTLPQTGGAVVFRQNELSRMTEVDFIKKGPWQLE
jgi:hypothetical protein